MGKIKVTENCNGIEGLKVIEPAVFGDARGYFMETYNYNDFAEAGIDCQFVLDNQSASKKGVLRGLHFQINYPQDKLVRVVNGEVFDVEAREFDGHVVSRDFGHLRAGRDVILVKSGGFHSCYVFFCVFSLRLTPSRGQRWNSFSRSNR